ncbi:MAG: hypothetical protein ACLQDY_29530, partial [Streptosporangiaceae bacterium]
MPGTASRSHAVPDPSGPGPPRRAVHHVPKANPRPRGQRYAAARNQLCDVVSARSGLACSRLKKSMNLSG